MRKVNLNIIDMTQAVASVEDILILFVNGDPIYIVDGDSILVNKDKYEACKDKLFAYLEITEEEFNKRVEDGGILLLTEEELYS